MLNRHHMHPLNLLLVGVVCITMFMWGIEVYWNLGEEAMRIHKSSLAGQSWDWSHVISGAIWVTGFSVGIAGTLINISHAIRGWAGETWDFSAIAKLEDYEVYNLNLWLDSNTYEAEHLKALWKEDTSHGPN